MVERFLSVLRRPRLSCGATYRALLLFLPSFYRHTQSVLVIRAAGAHPVPSRTRSLSPSAPILLPGQPGGNLGHRQHALPFLPPATFLLIFCFSSDICFPSNAKSMGVHPLDEGISSQIFFEFCDQFRTFVA